MKKLLIALSLLVIVPGFIILVDLSSESVSYYYNIKHGIGFNGPRNFLRPLSFTNVSGLADQGRLVLYWNHHPYPLSSLTSATLASLGLTQTPLYRDAYAMRYPKGIGFLSEYVSISFTKSGLNYLSIQVNPSRSKSLPVGISSGTNPELSFPIHVDKAVKAFGKPDDISAYKMHPILSRIRSFF